MDASDEFRFINTATSKNATSSSARRPRRNSSSSGSAANNHEGSNSSTTSTNSLRTVPVCVYNENRSFKLRFFWDKAFKLFNSHRPVYRAVSGINYQDCGTIGSIASTNGATASATLEHSPLPSGGTSLVKVRSQSHNQLNRLISNEMELFRGNSRVTTASISATATTSRIVTSVTSSSAAPNGRQNLYYDNMNGHGNDGIGGVGSASEELEFIPVVVPRRKNRAFGFSSSGNLSGASANCGISNGNATTNTAISTLTGKRNHHHHHQLHHKKHGSQSFLHSRPVSRSISGGEKPQGDTAVDVDGGSNDDSFYYNNNNSSNNRGSCDYDNISSIHATPDRSNSGGTGSNSTTGTSSTLFPHSRNAIIVPPHHHHSTVSATASLSAPVHLRRSQSTKSHHSGNESHQHHNNHRIITSNNQNHREKSSVSRTNSGSSSSRNVPSPTCSAYESWKSSATNTKSKNRFQEEVTDNSGCSCHTGYFYEGNCHHQSDKGFCNYYNNDCSCEGSCHCHEEGDGHHQEQEGRVRRNHIHQHHQVEEDSDTIGNDSGLDTWKKSSNPDDESPTGSVMKSSCGEAPGIVCTISQKIPSEQNNREEEYNTHISNNSERNCDVMNSRCVGGIGVTVFGDENHHDHDNMMIENGSVMYDSLDDTYSVPPMNGNTTVVLINGCCESDHCQNATLSDTFNFSDYDVECMSEIDLNSEPGSGPSEDSPNNGNIALPGATGNGESVTTTVGSMKYIICHSTSENELDSLDLAMFETKRVAAAAAAAAANSSTVVALAATTTRILPIDGESCIKLLNGMEHLYNASNNHNGDDDEDDRNSSLCAEAGGVVVTAQANETEGDLSVTQSNSSQLLLGQRYNTNNGTMSTTSSVMSANSTMTRTTNKTGDRNEENYSNWSDAGSEFEFVGPMMMSSNSASSAVAPTSTSLLAASTGLNRDIPMGHSPRGNPPDVEWEPYFCVLNQLDQTFTSYRSEEMSIFPGTPTRPRTQTNVFGENGISPTEIPRVRLDGGPNSIKCLINNAKWGMNPLMEEEEESNTTAMASSSNGNGNDRDKASGDYSSSSGSSSNQRPSSSPTSPLDTSYDKACGSERRGSAPLTPLLGRETPSRFANFFSKRSFKSNPLKRTKSVTKLERKKAGGAIEPESSGNILYPSRMRISRSHESLLAWTNNPVNSFVSNGMMSTMDLTAGDVSIRPLHPSILGQEHAFQVTTPTGSKYYTCSSAAERDSWVYAFRQAIRPRADEVRRRENALKIWILEGKGIPGGSSGKHSSKRYFCELYLDDVLYARTCGKQRGDMLFWGEHFEFTQLPNCVQLITVVFFREGDKKRKKERNTCIGKVKIPVNSVTSRYLIEKWYPVLPESSSHSSKEKEMPSLRIKCKYQSVDILPLRCYKSFLQYVKDQYGPLSECLESVLSVKAKEDLASAMVHVLHHENLAKEFIAELALQEILKSGDEKLTFRGNSIATKAMEAFLKLTGTEYLHATLGPFIEQFQGSEDLYDCEIDPMKLPAGTNLSKNQQNLRMAVDTVWKAIMHSHSIFPMELRECFSHCREALKSAGKEELSDHLISASIFLRFLCPAILSPSLFNITNEYPSEKSARNLTLIAKVLQTLANFTRFQGKENYMEFINDFVEREASNMKAFLSCISSPLSPEAVKKVQKESRDKVPAGGFIDLGKYLSILSALLSENVAKIAPKNDRFKQLQELLETIHKWLEQPANATNVSMFPFPHLPSPPPSGPPPPAPLGLPMNHRFSNPLCNNNNNSQAINHQYQIPHHIVNAAATPIYAVSSVIHNNSNPNVKNISQVQMNMNGNCNGVPAYPLQLQIPHVNPNQIGINNPRSGSQASSGYQSQSPVLEGEDKANKKTSHIKDQINAHINNINLRATEMQDATTALTFNNPVFNSRKVGSQSVDDLSTVGVEKNEDAQYPRRLARSSSSSDCEYSHSNVSPTKGRTRGQSKLYSNNANITGQQAVHSKSQSKSGHHRLSRRSSAELLRKNHPYSSSSDEDSDSGLVNERDEPTPHLPPRRNHIKRNSGHRPVPDGSSNGEKSLEEYEREMHELRRAMEALQVKLSRAEERLFGNESPGQNKRSGDGALGSPANSNGSGNGSKDRYSRSSDDGCKEMDQLLQRLLSAEEEMNREHDLLTALDKKQKLIEVQEQKIARLDSVNNQLLQALAQIRDSLQQQHVQQQQQKIQQQLLKQQQHLKNLANGFVPPCHNHTVHQSSVASQNSLNNNGSLGSRPNRPNQLQFTPQAPLVHRDSMKSSSSIKNNNCNSNANTTKVLITSSSSESLSQATGDSNSESHPSNRDSSALLGEQALAMLAELRSSSC